MLRLRIARPGQEHLARFESQTHQRTQRGSSSPTSVCSMSLPGGRRQRRIDHDVHAATSYALPRSCQDAVEGEPIPQGYQSNKFFSVIS